MYFDFLDKLVEKVFVFMEDVGIYDMKAAMEKTLKDGMRQFLGLMSVERTWMCWLVTMSTLLAMSHLGLWKWFKSSAMPRKGTISNATGRTTVCKLDFMLQWNGRWSTR